jgi:hypothetical protein
VIEGNRIRMDKPGDGTPVPAGTFGKSVGFKGGLGWEIEWENGVTTFFPNGNGDEVSTLAPEGEARCDFCSSKDPRWEHRCEDNSTVMLALGGGRTTAVIGQGSHGSWAACDVCHRLIEANKRDRLAKRAARSIDSSLPLNVMLPAMKQAHGMYWRYRVGPGFPMRQEADHGGR